MSLETTAPGNVNRTMVLISVVAGVMMTFIDQTIANVALPHMAGSVSASPDQISWVLTSYIIAAAICTPTTGWLAGRFGRKPLFMVSIIGFTIASALCGLAQSLWQIVAFRLLQGAFGAFLSPLSQAVILDTYPLEQRGGAMAVWSVGILMAPILGPVMGGWLTDAFNWRWVFYINVPVGIFTLLGVWTFLHEPRTAKRVRFDVVGFGLLSVMLGAFQLFLDRGQNNDWFHSPETTIEASVAAVALVLFAFHTVTAEHPFLPPALLKDRNFVTATLLAFALGMSVFPVLALLPPMTQTLLGYPAVTAGLVQSPRGIGNILMVPMVGLLARRQVDNRLTMSVGLTLFCISFWGMSHFDLQMDSWPLVWTAFVQGMGLALVFMPIFVLAFVTLPADLRNDGAGVFTLIRNLGTAAGISVMEALFAHNAQVAHARLSETLRADNPLAQPWLSHASGIAAVEQEVDRQASMISYIDVYHLMFWITVPAFALLLLLQKPSQAPAAAEPASLE